MVRTFRQSGFGQLFLGAVVVAIILAFVLTGSGSGDSSLKEECAVEVGEICVQPRDFIAAYGLVTSIGINEQAAKSLELKKQIALGLAERAVLQEAAKDLGIGTSEADVDRELANGRARVSLPAGNSERLGLSLALCIDGPSGCIPGTVGIRSLQVKKNGAFNFELYKRTVRNATGRSPSHFKEIQVQEHTAERVRELVRSQVKVSEEEAFLAYSRARSEATARVAQLNTSWFERYAIAPNDEAIEAFKKEHQAEIDEKAKAAAASWTDGCSIVSEIRLDRGTGEEGEADPKKALEAIRTRAKLRDDFSLLARKNSVANSAARGGRVGCLTKDHSLGADTLVAAAEKLEKPGDISEVIETPMGFTVLRLDARLTAENRESELQKHFSYELASASLATAAMNTFAEALIADLKAKKPIADATEALMVQLVEQGPLSGKDSPALTAADRPMSDISRSFSISQSPIDNAAPDELPQVALFELEAADAVVPTPTKTRTGLAVLQLKDKDMISREKFAEERDQVLSSLRTRKAEEALSKYISQLIEKKGGVTLNPAYVPEKSEEPTET